MFEKIICFIFGHQWKIYPPSPRLPDYKVCDRCGKSISFSPYLTGGEVEYIEHPLINAVSEGLIVRKSWFIEKDDKDE